MSKPIFKTPEEYIERNIKVFTEQAPKGHEFGTSYVQRVCRIGYNQARYTIEEMLDRKIIDYAESREWTYVLTHNNTIQGARVLGIAVLLMAGHNFIN